MHRNISWQFASGYTILHSQFPFTFISGFVSYVGVQYILHMFGDFCFSLLVRYWPISHISFSVTLKDMCGVGQYLNKTSGTDFKSATKQITTNHVHSLRNILCFLPHVCIIYGVREIGVPVLAILISLLFANQTEFCSHIDKNLASDTSGMLCELEQPLSEKNK